MPGISKRRGSIFKLGRRGRRGRTAFDTRWGYVARRSSASRDEQRVSAEGSPEVVKSADHEDEVSYPPPSDNTGGIRCDPTPNAGELTRNESRNPTERACQDVTVRDQLGHQTAPILADEGLSMAGNMLHSRNNNNIMTQVNFLDSSGIQNCDTHIADETVDGYCERDGEVSFTEERIHGTVRGEVLSDCDEQNSPGMDPQNVINAADGIAGPSNDSHCPDADIQNTRVWSAAEISSGLRKLCSWRNLLAVVVVTGSVRFSVQEFERFRTCMNALLTKGFPDEDKLPAYRTVDRTLLSCLRSWGFIQSSMYTVTLDSSKSGTRRPDSGQQCFGSFSVVKPSAWSVMDVSCPQTWKLLRHASEVAKRGSPSYSFETIEWSPILRCRDAVLSLLSEHTVPSGGEVTSRGFDSVVHRDVLWRLSFESTQAFPEGLLCELDLATSDAEYILSLTVKPIRTVLVTSMKTRSNLSMPDVKDIQHGTLPHLTTEKAGLWYAGDYCTAVRASTEMMFLMVVVHHQAYPGRNSRRFELICIPFRVQDTDEGRLCNLDWRRSRKYSASQFTTVTGDSISPERNVQLQRPNGPVVPSYGRLQSGLTYFVDHLLLYSDGFSQYSFKQGSAGGIYCLSLNYPPHLRRTRDSVRVLSVTPPGVSTSEGLRAIIDDLVTSATSGKMVRNADGEDMLLFTEVVAFVCEYHELVTVLDVMGQNGRGPCHLCTFWRFSGHPRSDSQYCYTTDVHSGGACYARLGSRMKALRGSNTSDGMLESLGFNGRERARAKASPLIQYYEALTERLQTVSIPLTECNNPVVSPRFDPYRSVLVAPDHLLAGIAINEMTLAFKALPTRGRRRQANAIITECLRRNGLLQESEIFNFNSSALHTTSISATFCIMLVAAPVFTEVAKSLRAPEEISEEHVQFVRRIVKNLCLFRKLVALTYWYPTVHVDDPPSTAAFNRNEGLDHIVYLQQLCVKYISECNDICKTSPLTTQELDKPNVHRLLELYHHSIPAMGHVRHFAELVFECAHQPLKRAMAHSNFKNSHIQCMNHCIGDDWKDRLAAAFSEHQASIDTQLQSLINLLGGRQGQVRTFVAEQQTLRDGAMQLLQNDLMKKMLAPFPTRMISTPFRTKWRVAERSEVATPHPQIQRLIQDMLPNTNPEAATSFDKAKRLKIWGNGSCETRSHARAHDPLMRGNVVQALVTSVSGSLVIPCSTEPTEDMGMYFIAFFAIEVLLQASNTLSYAAVRRCIVTSKGMLRVDKSAEVQLLELNDSVRRICIVHACASQSDPTLRCIRTDATQGTCVASVLDGSIFHFFGRREGYPPRMA